MARCGVLPQVGRARDGIMPRTCFLAGVGAAPQLLKISSRGRARACCSPIYWAFAVNLRGLCDYSVTTQTYSVGAHFGACPLAGCTCQICQDRMGGTAAGVEA